MQPSVVWRDFTGALAAEALKVRRSRALAVAGAAPIAVATMGFLILLFDGRPAAGAHAWEQLTRAGFGLWGALVLPLVVALQAALLAALEHDGRQWKHLFAQPVGRWAPYAAKLAVGGAAVAGASALLGPLLTAAGLTVRALRPELGFAGAVPWAALLVPPLRMGVAAAAALAIHTYLSTRWRSVAVGVGVGLAATVVGIVLANLGRAPLFPWTLPLRVTASGGVHGTTAALWGLAGGAVFGALGAWDVARRDAPG